MTLPTGQYLSIAVDLVLSFGGIYLIGPLLLQAARSGKFNRVLLGGTIDRTIKPALFWSMFVFWGLVVLVAVVRVFVMVWITIRSLA